MQNEKSLVDMDDIIVSTAYEHTYRKNKVFKCLKIVKVVYLGQKLQELFKISSYSKFFPTKNSESN